MKNSFSRTVSILILLVMVFPQLSGLQIQIASINTDQLATDVKKCSSDKNAPCVVKVFSNIPTNSIFSGVTPFNTTKSYTCGVSIYNGVQNLVSKLSETVSVTWDANGFKINSASRSPWVLNSLYGWKNLSGPTPNSGYYNALLTNGTPVTTTGDNTYLGARWFTYIITMGLNGWDPQISQNCSYVRQ